MGKIAWILLSPCPTAMAFQACAARPDFDVGAVDSNSDLVLRQGPLLTESSSQYACGYFIEAVRKVANTSTY